MAGKPGMHKKSLNPAAMQRLRESIRAGMLISKLENHVLNSEEMTASQISAALGLLKKCLPDLSNVEHSGKVEHTLTLAEALIAIQD